MAFHKINGKCSLRFEDWNKKAALCPAGTNYHCLLNDLGTYGEICEPSFWIQTNYCIEYNTKSQKIALKLCKGRHGCPSIDYLSDTVYQYSACFHDDNTATDSSTTLRSTTKAESDPDLPPWAVAMSIVLPLGIVILALVIALLVMRSRRRKKKRVNQDEEEPMLPDEKDPEQEIQKHDEDNTFYDGIEVVAVGWGKLTQYGVVILVGVTGAGKTKCGLELLSMVRKVNTDERKYKCHILRNFDDFEKFASSKVHYCLFLDDCLDRWSYSGVGPSIENDIIRLENVFTNYIRGKSAQVVLTVNIHTWNRFAKIFKGRNFFRAEHIISVGALSYRTKMEVLKKHLYSNDGEALEERQGKGNSGDGQDNENSGGREGNKSKTRAISDGAMRQSSVNVESGEIQGGKTKHAGNDNGGGKGGSDIYIHLQVNTSEECRGDNPTSRPYTRIVASNVQQSNRETSDDLNRDTYACFSGKVENTTSSHMQTDEDTQEKNIAEVAKDDVLYCIEYASKLVKHSGKGGPTQVPTEEIKREGRYKVDEKMIEKIAMEPWKEYPKLGFQPMKPFYLGFPEACALYSRDDKLLEKGEEFFKDPINCLSKRFSEWRDSKEIKEREKYVALVYMLMNGGYMDIRSIKGELLNVAKSFCKDGYIINEDAVKEGVAVLLRSYCVEKSPGCFKFQHEIIEYTLLFVAVTKHPKQTFENCDLNVLKRFMITKRNWKPEGELKLPVDSDFFELLAHRFVMSTVSLENHRCMEDERFERKYNTYPGTAV